MKDKTQNVQIDCTSNNVVLIITACIQPNLNQGFLVLKNTEERLRQYLACIEFYVKQSPFCNIVFCDNSNFPIEQETVLTEQAAKVGKKLEMLRFMGNSELVVRYNNKGIGEDEIMNYIMVHSSLVARAKTFFKITGRLLVTNLSDIVKEVCYGENYFYRDIYMDDNYVSVDTRFYAMDVDSYNQLLRCCYKRLNDYVPAMERAFFSLLNKQYTTFQCYPRFIGRSSGVGTDYGNEPKFKLFILDLLCRWGLFNKDIFFVPVRNINILHRKYRTLRHKIGF